MKKSTIKKNIIEKIGITLVSLSTLIVITSLVIIFFDIISKGYSVISFDFFTTFPKKNMTEGGILPAIVGTFYVTIASAIFSVPFGIMAGIYLSEYAKTNKFTTLIKATIKNLAGVPSIVYGLFGLGLFVTGLGFGESVLSAGITLGLLVIPVIITATEEALKRVPDSYRDASIGLGATKWQTIKKVLLPSAGPGIMTGIILSIGRAAGETAPILFTGAAFYLNSLPGSIFDKFMALPYHIFTLSTQHAQISKVRPIAYGSTLVLIIIVFLLSSIAFFLRLKLRRFGGNK
ncbi:MAG TPA: phosphate ABC transporter permease PstA [Spirochaetota bacterium]|nr:phosphate ABC transporter permease PstA [Spirochaetota bacterium]HOM37845.1 phosphate ABC transporter permease PstA [Spirochaetota bacterium]HPQ49278.1 phosphate ABC transporter permease PstA [Spirochaetota bacterium]